MTSTWWRRPLDRSFLMLGAAAVLALGGQAAMPSEPPAPDTVVVPISSLALSCPALPADTPGLGVQVQGALLGAGAPASLDLQMRKPKHGEVRANGVTAVSVPHAGAALFSAEGVSATQLVADAQIIGTTSGSRGYATYACQPPSVSQWLVGGSAASGRTSVLDIANIDDTVATVDIEVWSDLGKSASRSLQGVEIPPRSVEQLSLALVEPGRPVYAVHVIATSGQVMSNIVHRGVKALASLGVDVVSPVASPLANSMVGVIPEGATGVQVALLSPGAPTAVHVSLMTSDGTYPLADAENITLDADKVTVVPIPDDALVSDVVVLVEADGPVAVGVSGFLSIRGGSDLMSASAMAPIYRVSSLTIDSRVSKAVALLQSSVDASVTVRVDTGASSASQTVALKPGIITRVKLVGGSGSAHLVAITPSVDGVVSGSVVMQRASVGMVASSVQPLGSIRGYVAVPPVAPDTSR